MRRLRLLVPVAIAALAFGGCATAGSDTSSSESSSSPQGAPPSHESGYTGLGASTAAFSADHSTTAPRTPTPGVGTYHIERTRRGRVTEFSVEETDQPPANNLERLALVEGINLPDDAAPGKQTATCHDFRSRKLARLTGSPFAEAFTISGSTMAQIAVVPRPTC